MVAALDALEPHDGRMHEPLEQLGRARLEHAAGSPTAALARLDAAADELTASGQHARALLVLHERARLGAPDVARTLAAAACCQSPFHTAMADHVVAVERRDGEALADVAERFAAFGAELIAAEAAASARDAFARGRRPAGRGAGGRARSRELAERCEGAATAALDVGHG